jgi:uncharacterized FlaG/YvyC family protein
MEIHNMAQDALKQTKLFEGAQLKRDNDALLAQKMLENKAEADRSNATERNVAPTESELAEMVDSLNEIAGALQTKLRFGYNDDIGALYLSVLDSSSGTVIRQIPSAEAIRFAVRMRELANMILGENSGLLLDEQA